LAGPIAATPAEGSAPGSRVAGVSHHPDSIRRNTFPARMQAAGVVAEESRSAAGGVPSGQEPESSGSVSGRHRELSEKALPKMFGSH